MQDAGEAVLRMSKDMDNGTGRWGPWPQKTWRVHEVGGARLITQVARVSWSQQLNLAASDRDRVPSELVGQTMRRRGSMAEVKCAVSNLERMITSFGKLANPSCLAKNLLAMMCPTVGFLFPPSYRVTMTARADSYSQAAWDMLQSYSNSSTTTISARKSSSSE